MKSAQPLVVASLLALAAAACAEDSYVYGLEPTLGIFKVDVVTGAATPVDLFSDSGANSLAYDIDNNTFYYQDAGGKLLAYDATTQTTTNISVSGLVNGNNATYYKGNYLYDIPAFGTGSVVTVDLSTNTITSTQAVSGLIMPAYGDIAIDASGTIYAHGNTGAFQKFGYNPLTSASNIGSSGFGDLQVAFDQFGNLYALGSSGTAWTLDTVTGTQTLKASSIVWDNGGTNVFLNSLQDAASAGTPGPTPEPFTFGLGLAGLGYALRRRAKTSRI